MSPDPGPEEDHHPLHDQVRAGAGVGDPGPADSDVMMIIMAMVTLVWVSPFFRCAPVMVELEGETDPLQIAMKELKQRKIPIIIRRYSASEKKFGKS